MRVWVEWAVILTVMVVAYLSLSAVFHFPQWINAMSGGAMGCASMMIALELEERREQ